MRSPRSATLRVLVVVAAVAAGASPLLLTPRVAQAQTEEAREEARRLFSQGSSAFLAKRYTEALESLRGSYKLVPSPNSGLLIARCLKELGRSVEAVEMYDAVAADARRRATDGDTKYAQTADVATSEGNAVRATLGTVRVRVANPVAGLRIEIDGGVGVPATSGDIVALHPPGDVVVKLKPRTGAEQSQRATVVAGKELRVEFTAAPEVFDLPATAGGTPNMPPPVATGGVVPPPKEGEPPSWTMPASLVAGGVALAGAGLFIGFGLQSRSIYDELEQYCGKSGCPPAQRQRADEGKRDQTIANVGLAVGIAGAAATVVFLLVRAYSPRTAAGVGSALGRGALRVDF
jgi:hypothetical protein